jgi:hypothetical protein
MHSSIFRVKSIARAVLGRHRSRRPAFMAILSAYLDASGSVSDQRCHIFAVAGYVATDEQWESFEDEWQHALDEAGVSHLHMKHFAHSRGEFTAWKGDEPRRAQFLERLTEIIRSHDLEDFSVALNMEHYREVDKHFKMTESLGAYAMIASAAMGKIEKWHRRYRQADSLLFLLEKGDAQQDSIRKLDVRTSLPSGPEPIIISKQWKDNGINRYCLPMQASDLLAYEHAKGLTDLFIKGKRKARESLFQLSSRGIGPLPQTWTYLDANFLALSCKVFRVPKRE